MKGNRGALHFSTGMTLQEGLILSWVHPTHHTSHTPQHHEQVHSQVIQQALGLAERQHNDFENMLLKMAAGLTLISDLGLPACSGDAACFHSEAFQHQAALCTLVILSSAQPNTGHAAVSVTAAEVVLQVPDPVSRTAEAMIFLQGLVYLFPVTPLCLQSSVLQLCALQKVVVSAQMQHV